MKLLGIVHDRLWDLNQRAIELNVAEIAWLRSANPTRDAGIWTPDQYYDAGAYRIRLRNWFQDDWFQIFVIINDELMATPKRAFEIMFIEKDFISVNLNNGISAEGIAYNLVQKYGTPNHNQ